MGARKTESRNPGLPSVPDQLKPVSPATVSIAVALGCILVWLKATFQIGGAFSGFENAGEVLHVTYLVSLAVTTATLFALGRFNVRMSKLLGSGRTRVAVPLGVAAGTALLALTGLPGPAGGLFIVAGGVVTGLFSACYHVIFGITLSLLPVKHSVAACVMGYVGAAVTSCFAPLLGPGATVALCAALAPTGMLALSYATKCLGFDEEAQRDPLPPQRAPMDAAEIKDVREIGRGFTACLIAAGFSFELVRILLLQLSPAGLHDASYALVHAAGTALLTALTIMAGLLLVHRRRENGGAVACYRVILTLLVLSPLLLMAPLVYPGTSVALPLAFDMAAFECLGMLMWVLVAGICHQYPQSSFRMTAYTRAAWSLGPLLGALMAGALRSATDLSLQVLFAVAVACAFAVLVMGTFFLTEDLLNRALNIMPSDTRRRFVERCQAVIRDFGLSEREGEVMIMLAKGRNLPYVQQELCLSKGTVSTHRQHIYQKLGVHSGQELIDLVQEYKA